MKNNLSILCSSALPCQSFPPLLFIISLSPALWMISQSESSSWKLIGGWRASRSLHSHFFHYVCVCVLGCDRVCVVFLLAAGLTSCPMETHWLSFLFNGQSGQCSQQPDGTGLTVWPVAFWCYCLSGKKNNSLLTLFVKGFHKTNSPQLHMHKQAKNNRLNSRRHFLTIIFISD